MTDRTRVPSEDEFPLDVEQTYGLVDWLQGRCLHGNGSSMCMLGLGHLGPHRYAPTGGH